MFQFVYWLKAIAAVLITNSHYADIWPISSLAFGGQLGNCLFFFVSGFTLYNIRDPFPKWYAKRIIRIYPALWIANALNFAFGQFSADGFWALFHCFIYPTWFHFVGSIMLLYLVLYVVRTMQKKWGMDLRWFMLLTLAIFALLYIFTFDKSYYHIDDIHEHWVRFMYTEALLMGLWFRENDSRIHSDIKWSHIGIFAVLTICYFAAKKLFSGVQSLSTFQCFLPVILLLYLASIATIFLKLEKRGAFPTEGIFAGIVKFIAGITLEIYLVQYIMIDGMSHFVFPVNFVLVTAAILLAAWLVHFIAARIQKPLGKALKIE